MSRGGCRERTCEQSLCTRILVLHEICLGEPERVVWIVYNVFLSANGGHGGEHARLAGPSHDLVPPERRRFVEVLHQSVVPPQPHSIYHSPFVFVLVICIVFRILKDPSRVVGEWMRVTTCDTFFRFSLTTRRRPQRRYLKYRTIRIKGYRLIMVRIARVRVVVRVDEILRTK